MTRIATRTDRQRTIDGLTYGSRLVEEGVRCDDCDNDAETYTISGATPNDVAFVCFGCWKARLKELRRTRPTLNELIARVNRSIDR